MSIFVNTYFRNLSADESIRRVAVIVAYPADETIWAGGLFLSQPKWQWTVVAVRQTSKPDCRERFQNALKRLGARGEILPSQHARPPGPVTTEEIHGAVERILELVEPDLVVTHSPAGECARLADRGLVGKTVSKLWKEGKFHESRLWTFAYEDSSGKRDPIAIDTADRYSCLSREVWTEKRSILIEVYGFAPDSFIARAVPREEAFFCLRNREKSLTPGKPAPAFDS